MDRLHSTINSSFSVQIQAPRLLLIETEGRPGEGLTELFAALAMRGSFYAIAGGEWLPTYALARSLRRRTTAICDVLSRIRIARPFTCYQLLDLLTDIRPEREPVLILDFLHHFHNPDVPLDVRRRVLRQCCKRLEVLSLLRPLVVFLQALPTEEYRSFFPLVAGMADEVLQAPATKPVEVLQPLLL
jgi:hypothetical protein